MTIRTTLLLTFLLISLITAIMVTGLAYYQARELLITEIQNTLQAEAITAMEQVDATLFERVQNLVTWSNQDIMQEIRINDVDKRLSEYFLELRKGYEGFYAQLYAVSNDGVIVAASPRSLINAKHAIQPAWLRLDSSSKTVFLERLDLSQDSQRLVLRTTLDDDYAIEPLGSLYASFNWTIISRLLGPKIQKTNDSPTVVALLVDKNGQIIGQSSVVNQLAIKRQAIPASWLTMATSSGVMESEIDFFDDSKVIVGYARSSGYHGLPELGWTTFIIQSRTAALMPVAKLWHTFFLILIVAFLLAVIASLVISNKISKPIVSLTSVTRDYMHTGQFAISAVDSYQEVGELTRTFNELIDNLETSRADLVRITKLAVIGEMAASLAHDVRTPLGILRSSAQMLQMEKSLSAEGLEIASIIIEETHRLNGLVTTLLECAQPKPPQFQEHDIHEILTHCTVLLAIQMHHKNIRLQQQFNANLSVMRCDRDQMIQVFLNLMINAIQNIHSGCYIQIVTLRERGHMIIEINDDGPGVSEQDRSHIFEPFFTRRNDGTGLGLTVVQQIVLAHHGKISVHSSRQGGACFRLIFPPIEPLSAKD